MSTIKRDHRFTVTPEHLILDPRISDRAFRLWCRLDRYAGEKVSAYPTRETLAIELDASPSSIDRATKDLIEAGWLRVDERPGTSSNYTLMNAPSKETMKLVEHARAARKEATQPRREAKAALRRKQKATLKVNGSASPQVNGGGFTTGDDPQIVEGFTMGDDPGFITGDDRGFTTGDDQKEATHEGSNKEGLSPSPPSPETLPAADASSEMDEFALIPVEIPQPAAKTPTFEDFYAAYPKKVDRATAERAWNKAVKVASPAMIVAAAVRLAADPNLPMKGSPDWQFVKYPATWLNAGSYADQEPLPPRGGSAQRGPAYSNDSWGTLEERIAHHEASNARSEEEIDRELDVMFAPKPNRRPAVGE